MMGYGEPTLEGRSKAVEMAVRGMERYLIGKDPLRIEYHWQAMYRGKFYRGGPVLRSAISGIEQAFWDILGKKLRAPIHQLLGGACEIRFGFTRMLVGARRKNALKQPWLRWKRFSPP